ncbi:mCG1051107 [Mus musculus]|nr:mCG1051107 [Mus musculus]
MSTGIFLRLAGHWESFHLSLHTALLPDSANGNGGESPDSTEPLPASCVIPKVRIFKIIFLKTDFIY